MKRFLEVLASPLWTVLALLAAAALVYVRVRIGPIYDPVFLFILAVIVLGNTVLRFGYQLYLARTAFRYPRRILPRMTGRMKVAAAPEELRERLSSEGYAFRKERRGWYGERREAGFWGGVLISASILIIMVTGMYNYLNQFQGLIFVSPRATLDLADNRSYDQLALGPMRSLDELDINMHMRRMMLPPDGWPQGGADLVITDREDNVLWEGVLTPESGHITLRGLRFSMPRLMYEGMFTFLEDDKIIWGGELKFHFLQEPKGRFLYQGDFHSFDPEENVTGTVLLDPKNEPREILYRVTIFRDGEEKATFDLGMGSKQKAQKDNFKGTHWGYARWVEIDVTTPRILFPLYIGGVLLIAGIIARLIIRPRRLWIRTENGGATIKAGSFGTKRLVMSIAAELIGQSDPEQRNNDIR